MLTVGAFLLRCLLVVLALGASSAVAGPGVGEPAELEAVTLDGEPLSLERLKGKVVMVGFWATWCGICRAEMPGWQAFYAERRDRGFELVAVSIDEDAGVVKRHLEGKSFTFPVAWRWHERSDDNFGEIFGTPTLYVVGKDGKIAWAKRGRVPLEQLAAVVEPLLVR